MNLLARIFQSHRLVCLGIFGFSALMMLTAFFYFQEHLGLMPCPLCVSQRIFVILAGVIALAAVLHNADTVKINRIYSGLIMLAAMGGAAISSRQVWLQSLPESEVPACGPTLGYLYEYFPMQEVLEAMFFGEGSCAEIKWQFLGLSIPGWTLVAFIAIIAASGWLLFKRSTATTSD